MKPSSNISSAGSTNSLASQQTLTAENSNSNHNRSNSNNSVNTNIKINKNDGNITPAEIDLSEKIIDSTTTTHSTSSPLPLHLASLSDSPLPFRPSLWRAASNINAKRSPTLVRTPDLERGASMRAQDYFGHHASPTPSSPSFSSQQQIPLYTHTDLHRDNSIATAISMRRADIIVSRDNPQNLHQQRTSGLCDEEIIAVDNSNINNNDGSNITTLQDDHTNNNSDHVHTLPTRPPVKDELLFEKKKSIIILLGRILLKCGCPCHRVDECLAHTAKALVLDASFSFLPDSVLVTFTEGNDCESIMVKSPQGYDNGKIVKINDIMNWFYRGDIDLDRCLILLHDVATAPPTCGLWTTLVFFTLSSFTASATMFGGTWIDAGVSGVLGLFVAILFLLSAKFPIYARVFEISASVMVAIITRALYKYCCFTGVVLSAILILLPGYTMTVGVIELSARHVTTGVVRLVYAVFYAFQLAYGLQVGSSLYSAIDPDAPQDGLCGQPLISPWFYIPLVPLLGLSIALSYGSTRKQWISQVISATIAFCLTFFLGKAVPDGQIVGSIAAFAVALYSNFALKLTGEPPLASLSVGVTLLVPGSIGVRGAFSVLNRNDLGQTNFPMQMLTIALGLSAGVYAAAMIVYPAGKKKSMYISL